MSLGTRTRCILVVAALSFFMDRLDGHDGGIRARNTEDLPLAGGQVRILLVTLLGLGLLLVLGCLGCACCHSRMSQSAASSSDGLDVYAPRTQSIVWPALPLDTARVLEVTFLHTPKPGCLCRRCRLSRDSFCIENCGVITQCA